VLFLIDEHKFRIYRPCRDFFFLGTRRLALLLGALFRDAPRQPIFGNGRAGSRDFTFAVGGAAVHDAFKPGHLGIHRTAFGGEFDRQTMARGHEFKYRRGRACTNRHEQQHGCNERSDAKIATPKKLPTPRLS
jgi:hypothetical protein